MQILAITFSSAAVNHHQGCLKLHCGETKPADTSSCTTQFSFSATISYRGKREANFLQCCVIKLSERK
jgi:hypothetical protein